MGIITTYSDANPWHLLPPGKICASSQRTYPLKPTFHLDTDLCFHLRLACADESQLSCRLYLLTRCQMGSWDEGCYWASVPASVEVVAAQKQIHGLTCCCRDDDHYPHHGRDPDLYPYRGHGHGDRPDNHPVGGHSRIRFDDLDHSHLDIDRDPGSNR